MKMLGPILGGVLLLIVGTARAADLQKGIAAYLHGDYVTAFAELTPLAEQGDAFAQFDLGSMYQLGQGVSPDNTQAVAWYRKAALQGFAPAQNRLGNMYGMGRGVPQDYDQAVVWYRKAAEQGYSEAQDSLGLFYAMGRGVPRDYVIAYALIHLAAKHDKTTDDDLNRLASRMTPAQMEDSKALIREMKRVGMQAALRSHPTVSANAPNMAANAVISARDSQKAFPIQLRIDQNGSIYWNAILVGDTGLKAQFAVIRQMANQPGVRISIRGDAKDPKIKEALAVVLADASHYNITHVEVIGR